MHQTQRDDRDYQLRQLSAGRDGRGIKVQATGSPGTLIHTALNSEAASEWDAIVIQAVNTSSTPVELTLEWGGTDPDDRITVTIPGTGGLINVVSGLILQNAVSVRAFASVADTLVLHGFVRRYQQI